MVDLRAGDILALAEAFPPPDYYFDAEAAHAAARGGGMVNLLEASTGDKVDLWMFRDDGFDASRLSRRWRARVAGVEAWFSSAEDLILQKLRFGKELGGSQKQFGDAAGIYVVQGTGIDEAYLDRWALRLGVEDDLARLRRESGGSGPR